MYYLGTFKKKKQQQLMPGSCPQNLKDVTPGIMTSEVLQGIRMESKVWEPHSEKWKAMAYRGQIIPTKSNGSKSNQRPKHPSPRASGPFQTVADTGKREQSQIIRTVPRRSFQQVNHPPFLFLDSQKSKAWPSCPNPHEASLPTWSGPTWQRSGKYLDKFW